MSGLSCQELSPRHQDPASLSPLYSYLYKNSSILSSGLSKINLPSLASTSNSLKSTRLMSSAYLISDYSSPSSPSSYLSSFHILIPTLSSNSKLQVKSSNIFAIYYSSKSHKCSIINEICYNPKYLRIMHYSLYIFPLYFIKDIMFI